MNIRLIRRVLLALLPVAGAAWLAAQTTSTTPTPAPQPTNPVPDAVLTPGTASLTPGPSNGGTTGASGATGKTDLYSIPQSTPVGMPSHMTPMFGSSAAGRPLTNADCAGSGWRGYAALGFQDQKSCEAWVEQHAIGSFTPRAGASGSSGAPMTTPSLMTTPSRMTAPYRQPTVRHPVNPARRATPPAEPATESTPGSSITPLSNPTPER